MGGWVYVCVVCVKEYIPRLHVVRRQPAGACSLFPLCMTQGIELRSSVLVESTFAYWATLLAQKQSLLINLWCLLGSINGSQIYCPGRTSASLCWRWRRWTFSSEHFKVVLKVTSCLVFAVDDRMCKLRPSWLHVFSYTRVMMAFGLQDCNDMKISMCSTLERHAATKRCVLLKLCINITFCCLLCLLDVF